MLKAPMLLLMPWPGIGMRNMGEPSDWRDYCPAIRAEDGTRFDEGRESRNDEVGGAGQGSSDWHGQSQAPKEDGTTEGQFSRLKSFWQWQDLTLRRE